MRNIFRNFYSRAVFLAALLILGGACFSGAWAAENCPAGAKKTGEQVQPYQPQVQEVQSPPEAKLPPPETVFSDYPSAPLTLCEAVNLGLRHQSSLTMAAGQVQAAAGLAKQANSALFPTLSVAGSYTGVNSNNSATTGAATTSQGTTALNAGYQVVPTLQQLLYDFNHTRSLALQARSNQAQAQADYTQAQYDLILQIKQAFYTCRQCAMLIKANQSNLDNQKAHRDLTKARFKAGIGVPSDVVRSETAVTSAVFNLSQAQNNYSLALVALANLMGVDPRTPIEIADSAEPLLDFKDPQGLFTQALSGRPELKSAQAAIEAGRYGLSAAKSADGPALNGNAGWSIKGMGFPLNNSAFLGGVTLQWKIYDSGLREGEIQQQSALLQTAEAGFVNIREQILAQVAQAYLNLQTAQHQVASAEAELTNAKETLRLIDGRYRSGLATFIEVLDAQNALLTADTNLINAAAGRAKANAALLHAIGETGMAKLK